MSRSVGVSRLAFAFLAVLGCGSVSAKGDAGRAGTRDASDGDHPRAGDGGVDGRSVVDIPDAGGPSGGGPGGDGSGPPVVWDSTAARWDDAVWR
jgi:hypothetical protein